MNGVTEIEREAIRPNGLTGSDDIGLRHNTTPLPIPRSFLVVVMRLRPGTH